MTPGAGITEMLARLDVAERRFCQLANRSSDLRVVQACFRLVSRLGDGVFWYALMLALPLGYGRAGMYASMRIALAAFIGLAIYRALKERFVRERPHVSSPEIRAAAPALDRYSFPSGHTLHAVSFTWLATEHFPELAWFLVPFALLVAMSRVVLGLHYPTDVLVGGAIGWSVARLVAALM
jgi:undecaprenyl-diphosphatase